MAIIPQYRVSPISGYHVTDIGTPDIVPDIDPDIRYVVYDIGAMMTRYRVSTRYSLRYPISGHGHMRHVPISGQKKTPISGHMTRYRVSGLPDIGKNPDIGFGKVPDAVCTSMYWYVP